MGDVKYNYTAQVRVAVWVVNSNSLLLFIQDNF